MAFRVLFMQSQYFFGADSEIHAQLMRYFDRSDCEVFVACTDQKHDDPQVDTLSFVRQIPDVQLRLTDFGPSKTWSRGLKKLKIFRLPLTLLALAKYVRDNKIDVIHTTEKPRDAIYGVIVAKLSGSKSVVHMHISYGEWMSRSLKWAFKNADGMIGVSDFTAHSVVQAGFPEEKVYSVLNGLALTSSRWNHIHSGDKIREEFSFAPDQPLLGIVARIFPWKGHTDLIHALALIRDEFPDVRLLIVGEADIVASDGKTSYIAELKQQIADLHLEENVIFTGFRTDIPELMAAMDVYTMPSWEEPFGMVYVEAMSQEKPVVCWANGGPKQIVVEGETGFLVTPKDISGFAEATCQLLRDPEMRNRFGKAGRKRVQEHFTSQRMCADVVDVYHAVVKSPQTVGTT